MFYVIFCIGLLLMSFCLILSIFFFVKNHVAKLIGDMTGWTMRKGRKEFYKRRVEAATVVLTCHGEEDLREVNRENGILHIFEVEDEIMEVHTNENIGRR